jgi:hypothetical protein
MNMSYSAGKGVRFPADPELMKSALDALVDAYGAIGAFAELKDDRKRPDDVIRFLVSEGFSFKSDDFGTSAHKGWPTGKKGEQLRVSVVLNTNKVLAIDVRNWYES